jgi:hypothetical protein
MTSRGFHQSLQANGRRLNLGNDRFFTNLYIFIVVNHHGFSFDAALAVEETLLNNRRILNQHLKRRRIWEWTYSSTILNLGTRRR